MSLNLKLRTNGEKYFEGDWVALEKYQKAASESYSLDLHLYPEPFAGNPDAPVYILNGNPGLDKHDRSMMQYPDWSEMMVQSYNPTNESTMYWLDEQWESKIFSTALNSPGTYRSGFRWWLGNKDRTQDNSIWESGIASSLKNSCQDLHKKVFNVEYFPYHSKSLNMNLINKYIKARADDPNSVVGIVNEYLRKALKEGKVVFIVMRCEEYWINRLNNLLEPSDKITIKEINGRNFYDHNIVTLKNRQRIWLTQGNILENPSSSNDRWKLICDSL